MKASSKSSAIEDHRPIDLDVVREELSRLISSASSQSFFQALDNLVEDEVYYLCGAGAIMRVLRGPSAGGGGVKSGYAALVEFYALDGTLLDKRHKGFEPSSVFAIQYDDSVSKANFYTLAIRPSFVTAANASYKNSELAFALPNHQKKQMIQARIPKMVL